jgi:DNA-directed RNA polymerase specialized sigma24 family protein
LVALVLGLALDWPQPTKEDQIRGVAYLVCRNALEAEDVVQQTFLRVLEHYGKMRDVRDKRDWLIGIAWKITHGWKRRAKARPVPEDISIIERSVTPGQLSPETSNTTQQA